MPFFLKKSFYKVCYFEKLFLSLQNNSRPTLENNNISPYLLKLPSDVVDLGWGCFYKTNDMNLISEQKKKQGFDKACKEGISIIPNFSQGVSFAEEELKNLAIEFAEWVVSESFEQHNDCSWSQNWEDGHFIHNSIALFEKFIEQRNKP